MVNLLCCGHRLRVGNLKAVISKNIAQGVEQGEDILFPLKNSLRQIERGGHESAFVRTSKKTLHSHMQ